MKHPLKSLAVAIALTAALVFMALRPAHAANTTLPLADPLVGHWCPVRSIVTSRVNREPEEVYKRGLWDCDGNLVIKQDGYADEKKFCKFTDVKRFPRKNGYLIRSNCEKIDRRLTEEFWITGGLLHLQTLHGYVGQLCAVVHDNMPDGFLNLRAGPGMRYDVRAKLVTGDELRINDQDDEWLHVVVPRLPGINGWVHTSYVNYVKCEEKVSQQ